jgi:hypothetical protein
MSVNNLMNIMPPESTREQLRHVLAIMFGQSLGAGPLPFSAFEPLGWLLRDDVGNSGIRGVRRHVYRTLVRRLEFEFEQIDRERLSAANGPWTLESIYKDRRDARKCIRDLRWCAMRHFLHLPSASRSSQTAFAHAELLSLRFAPADLS